MTAEAGLAGRRKPLDRLVANFRRAVYNALGKADKQRAVGNGYET